MSKVKRVECTTCGQGVQLSGHVAQANRVYWCTSCSVDETLAVRIMLPNGQISLGVFYVDGQPPVFHAIENLSAIKSASLKN